MMCVDRARDATRPGAAEQTSPTPSCDISRQSRPDTPANFPSRVPPRCRCLRPRPVNPGTPDDMMRHVQKRMSVALVATLAAACAVAITAGADFEPDADFTGYTSFRWDEPDARPTGDPRLESNPFFSERLHDAIQRELEMRGILLDGSGPALEVHHHATVRDRVEVYDVDLAAGYAQPVDRPGTRVIQYEEGTFLVDIADARTREVVWRGWAQLDVGRALDDAGQMREQIDRALERMFEDFPAPKLAGSG